MMVTTSAETDSFFSHRRGERDSIEALKSAVYSVERLSD